MRSTILSLLVCFTLIGSAMSADILNEQEGISPVLDEFNSIEIVDEVTCTETVEGTVNIHFIQFDIKCEGSATAPTAEEACRKAHEVVQACLDNWGL